MRLRIAALAPLALVACTAPEPLPDASALTAPASTTSKTSAPSSVALFAGFTPRPVVEPGNWRNLNDGQSPTGGSN